MSLKYFEHLKKSMESTKLDPQLLPNLIEEMHFFFQTLRVKLESKDPALRQAAAEEVRELRILLEEHPLIRSNLSQ